MSELVFLRHGPRADHCKSGSEPLHSPYKPYDLLVTQETRALAAGVAEQIVLLASFEDGARKNVFVHFSPYLRCCETADLLVSALREHMAAEHPQITPRFQLLCDFALGEWIHDKMKNKPPFQDSTEAYQMYTPNIQMMENRKHVAAFRPTTKLGPWNEAELSFKEFQDRCKKYLQKLLATYDKPSHAQDLVVVVGHGYGVLDLLLHFIAQPIFQEIPELGVNFATRQAGQWRLQTDCLGMLARDPALDATLNLETDIVYYKTNFIKKQELDETREFPAMGFGGLKAVDGHPRPSFKIKLVSTKSAPGSAPRNPLCPAAKNWDPQRPTPFLVKSEFRLKVMNDEAFRKAFDITRAPRQPTSPEISPNSEPSKINSTIDLSKLRSNEEIYRPLKLKYSLAADIPVQYLNSKVNSHVSLHHMHPYASTGSSLDLARAAVTMHIMPGTDSCGLASPRDATLDAELAVSMPEVISRLSRVRSLQKRRAQTATPKFGIISEQDTPPATQTENTFALSFGNALDAVEGAAEGAAEGAGKPNGSGAAPKTKETARSRSGSVKFVPSSLAHETRPEKPEKKENKTIFYNFNSGSTSSDDSLDEEHCVQKYMWFGQNARPE